MEDRRERYEFILGFVAIMISLSAFKDELALIQVNVGFAKFTLSHYFLVVIIGFLLCLYLHVIERVFRDTRFGHYKVFDHFLKVAYVLFVLLLASPILVLLSWCSYKIIFALRNIDDETKKTISMATIALLGVISGILSQAFVTKYQRAKKNKQQEVLELEEIKEIEKAVKLLEDSYYSQSILEAFKVLELHLYKLLAKRDIRVQRHRFFDLVKFAQKAKLISDNDIGIINEIRKMRNAAAHLDIQHTKEQSEIAVNFVKGLIKRNA